MPDTVRKPNVIVFFTDQQRYDTTGVHGNPCNLTPNFDRMACDGTHAALAFTPQPVCGPARACVQSGKYATAVGVHRNGIPLPQGENMLARCFARAGYRTGYIGKWHLGSTRGAVAREERAGYDYWLGANALEWSSRPYDTLVYDGEDKPVRLPGYRVDALTDAAIRYIDANREEPFFLFLSFLEPHFQNSGDSYPAPDVWGNTPAGYMPPDLGALGGTAWQHLGGYYGMVRRLDEALGRMMDALKSLGLAQDTVIAFASDHGCHFKTRNSEYKRSCHESSIRIPMAFTGGPFTGGGRLREMVSLVDLAPTLLDACGVPVPEEMQGHSILPLLHGRQADWPGEIYVQISEAKLGRAVRTKRWKYAVVAPDADPARDAMSALYEEEFLYDLENDPYELCNLIHSQAHDGVAAVLREKLLGCMRGAGEGAARIIPAERAKMGQRTVFEGEEAL